MVRSGPVSHDQRHGILTVAGRLLLKHRKIDLYRLDRDEANKLLWSLLYEEEHGVIIADPPPPDTRKRKR